MTTATKYPARQLTWLDVESSNVKRVGYASGTQGMYVEYLDGSLYFYSGVTRQQVVACANASSVGGYLHRRILPKFDAVRIP